ncbi:peptidase MA family metallohydrolase [Schlesneria paludicola]|uniref:peptidase MA family metallohydrolase n=1 Tax=Schlesneria paludicola TaxID=360056 RepID=UPI0012F9F838|nr:peptidase MA family metallohydrolase [Schlesneria paludicola]
MATQFKSRTALVVIVFLTWLSAGHLSVSADERPESSVPLTMRVTGVWKVVESPNFCCRGQLADGDMRRLAECCEAWRSRLRTLWITGVRSDVWAPKCDVYVHPTQVDYNLALNRPGDVSVGSTMMNFDQGRVVFRRIDVRADANDWSNAALPHELTHVVLGERFGGRSIPRWADEGIAMLSESVEKHRVRLTNLQQLISRRQTLSLYELVSLQRIPGPQQRDAFYGQSVGLASWMIHRSTPARFADFVDECQSLGMEKALRQHYQIDGLAGLQRDWDNWMRTPDAIEFVSLQLHVGVTPILAANDKRP